MSSGFGSDANAGASSEPARPVDSADSPDRGAGVACSSACSIACPGATSAEDAHEADGDGEGRTAASASAPASESESASEEGAREA